MAVIESKGNGFSLFNGVKLPNIDSVWTDKETFPYAIVYTITIPTEPVTYSSIFVCMSVPCIYDGTSVKSSETALRGLYRLQDGVWTFLSEGVSSVMIPIDNTTFWSNHDILNTTDNSVHLAASEPIPLDGMNVIEWDGNTEGLALLSGTTKVYHVSSATNIDMNRPAALVRTHNTTGDLIVPSGVWNNQGNGHYNYSNAQYIPEANDVYSIVGVYFPIMTTYYTSLFAYYPIEEVSGDKTTISFNNKEYSIDTAALSPATSALKSHLSTVMSGAGAVINLGGTAYNVDSAKLTAITNEFVAHLGTIAGDGYKVVIGGVEYGVDSSKVAGAIAELETAFGGSQSDSGDSGKVLTFNGDATGKHASNFNATKPHDYIHISDRVFDFASITKIVAMCDGTEIECESTELEFWKLCDDANFPYEANICVDDFVLAGIRVYDKDMDDHNAKKGVYVAYDPRMAYWVSRIELV